MITDVSKIGSGLMEIVMVGNLLYKVDWISENSASYRKNLNGK